MIGFKRLAVTAAVLSLLGASAHAQDEKLIGKDLSEAQDGDGRYYVKERVDLGKTKQSFWQDYEFTNPVTKKIEPKQICYPRLDDTLVCGGIYKS